MERIATPLLLEPHYTDYVWGGSRLKPGQSPIAEAWVIYENDLILNGPLAGKTLAEAVVAAGAAVLGADVYARTGNRFPLLIKLLDCAQWLSLQVHPNDEQAVRLEGPGQYGKTEAWHFIESAPGSEVLAGLKPGTSRQALEAGIKEHKVLDLMERFEVKNGDSILIQAGMIHALGPGLLLYEVQQTSNWTYRVWDWDRPVSPQRLLHIEKSLAVSNPAATGTLVPAQEAVDGGQRLLVSCGYFDLSLLTAEKQSIALDTRSETCHALTVISGSACLEGSGWQQPLQRFQSVLVPADAGAYRLVPEGACQVLMARPGSGENQTMSSQPPSELQFPCEFPIKIIGNNHPGYQANMVAILLKHVPDLIMDTIGAKESSGGKYLSVSAHFTAQSRAQVDDLYRELTAHPDVKWVL